MTLYLGETVWIEHDATSNGVVLTDVDVDHVSVKVWDAAGEVVVDEVDMPWVAGDGQWAYEWVPDPELLTGTYRARCKIYGLDGSANWEYKRIRLARNPVA